MLKKILLTSIALSLFLSANSNINYEDIDCETQFESCVTKCESIESDEKNLICMEKCEAAYDKCQLSLETNAEILNDNENKDDIESEKSQSN